MPAGQAAVWQVVVACAAAQAKRGGWRCCLLVRRALHSECAVRVGLEHAHLLKITLAAGLAGVAAAGAHAAFGYVGAAHEGVRFLICRVRAPRSWCRRLISSGVVPQLRCAFSWRLMQSSLSTVMAAGSMVRMPGLKTTM